ncbi:MAG: hypothetical protein GY796_33115 [Chloroflexi bacterium]|nr:hypothetical protein [Chloroflexota bacterium]
MTQSAIAQDLPESQFSSLSVVSVWFGAMIIGLTAVGYSLSRSMTNSWVAVLDIFQFVLVALILASVFYLLLRWEDGLRVTAVPLLINIGTLIIIRLVPFGVIWEEASFRYHWHQYQTIVQKIETGEWQPDTNGIVTLPSAYRSLSADNGRVWVSQNDAELSIFFVTEQRGLNQFAGYMYHANGRPPQSGEFQGQWHTILQKYTHWYYCVSD